MLLSVTGKGRLSSLSNKEILFSFAIKKTGKVVCEDKLFHNALSSAGRFLKAFIFIT